jgi:hypothetical protein
MVAIAMSILSLLRTSETVYDSRLGYERLFQVILVENTKWDAV